MSLPRNSSPATELALLGFLRLRPMHGYEIHRHLVDPDGLDGLWRLKLSRLYAMLGRLEAQGYITARTEQQGNRPPRKVFSLTPAGETVFLAWVEAPVTQPRDLRLGFMLKLYFALCEGNQTAVRLVADQQRCCGEWLAGPLVELSTSGHAAHKNAVHRFRRGQIEASRDWLDWLAGELARAPQ